MEILFCDLCNESVPDVDVKGGQASYHKGRLVCAVCNKAMGGPVTSEEPPPIPSALPEGGLPTSDTPAAPTGTEQAQSASSGGGGGVLVGLLALGFAAVGFTLVLDAIEGVKEDVGETGRNLETDVAAVRSEHRVHAAGLPGMLQASADGVRASEREAREELRGMIDGLQLELAASAERERLASQALMNLQAELEANEKASKSREDGLKKTITTLEEDLRWFSDRMIQIEENIRLVSAQGPVAPANNVGNGGGGASMPAGKPWESLLPDLKHANSGIRLDAVYELGETGDPDVAPHLIPMLSDVDLFVRMASCRMLEDLGAKPAVPALIEALEDSVSAVREQAMMALRTITKRNFGFEPQGSPGDRGKRVQSWRDWWEKDGEGFLAS